jgi:hypothetical protein
VLEKRESRLMDKVVLDTPQSSKADAEDAIRVNTHCIINCQPWYKLRRLDNGGY